MRWSENPVQMYRLGFVWKKKKKKKKGKKKKGRDGTIGPWHGPLDEKTLPRAFDSLLKGHVHVTGPYPESGRLAVVEEGSRAGEGQCPEREGFPIELPSLLPLSC